MSLVLSIHVDLWRWIWICMKNVEFINGIDLCQQTRLAFGRVKERTVWVYILHGSQKLKLIRCCRSVRCGKKIGISTVRYLPLILKKFGLEFLWFGFHRRRRNLTTSLSSAVKHRWICTNGFTGINLVLILESCVQRFHCSWFRRQIKVSFAT